MAFQAQQAPNYQGAASDIGQMFARKGKAHLTWAQAKRDRDERRAEMQFQKEREDQKYVRDSLMDAVKITAQAKRRRRQVKKRRLVIRRQLIKRRPVIKGDWIIALNKTRRKTP